MEISIKRVTIKPNSKYDQKLRGLIGKTGVAALSKYWYDTVGRKNTACTGWKKEVFDGYYQKTGRYALALSLGGCSGAWTSAAGHPQPNADALYHEGHCQRRYSHAESGQAGAAVRRTAGAGDYARGINLCPLADAGARFAERDIRSAHGAVQASSGAALYVLRSSSQR